MLQRRLHLRSGYQPGSHLEPRGVTVEVRIDDGADSIHADRIQLQQVLVNLIQNGREAREQIEAQRQILITARADGRDSVEVRDTGCGLRQRSALKPGIRVHTTQAVKRSTDGYHNLGSLL